ncbi:MAG: hypothetical protein P1V36_05155, partial [Planctomycetota bacterium]|nr:hypothetical protein [Planctomycetota bacterium]
MDEPLQRTIHFVGGFFLGAAVGGTIGAMVGTWVGYHQRILHEPLQRLEYEWAYAWPFALGFG